MCTQKFDHIKLKSCHLNVNSRKRSSVYCQCQVKPLKRQGIHIIHAKNVLRMYKNYLFNCLFFSYQWKITSKHQRLHSLVFFTDFTVNYSGKFTQPFYIHVILNFLATKRPKSTKFCAFFHHFINMCHDACNFWNKSQNNGLPFIINIFSSI